MKKIAKNVVAFLLMVTLVFVFTSCNDGEHDEKDSVIESSGQITEKTEIEREGLWENATYVSDQELGEGSKKIFFEVKIGEQSVKFTINTDATIVGDALLQCDLIAGEEGAYGLYVKTVNGITADYDIDHSYWAFNINGNFAMTGVSSTELEAGSTYQFVYAK